MLAIHVGPVQPFIEAARRFSDLAVGSNLLSDLATAVAQGVEKAGGELVFPKSTGQESVANKIVATCKSPEIAAKAAAQARESLASTWNDLAARVRSEWERWLDTAAFDEQVCIEDWCQFYAAWATRPTYIAARDAAERLLDGRKRHRDFRQRQGGPVAKSWQDPGREDVLKANTDRGELLRKRLLKTRERLDALTFIKRFHPDRARFDSVNAVAVRVALQHFREHADPKRRDLLEQFEQ
ncbi:MAG TPA: type III-B CRISPR-associated protein Cas10/Cmr2, partial [Myxococcota bacterium]|nr:type III-B CRISPR-associated protein Cas10/Cmr2 [Myxococcota bacterium]